MYTSSAKVYPCNKYKQASEPMETQADTNTNESEIRQYIISVEYFRPCPLILDTSQKVHRISRRDVLLRL